MHFLRHSSAIFGLACGLAILPAAGQFSATIQSVTGPGGTTTAPYFVIDSDAANASASRDKVPVTMSVQFTRTSTTTSESFVYRMTGELIAPGGAAVTLSNGNTSLGGPATTVSMAAGTASVTRAFSLALDPGVDLGAGTAMTIRCKVQRGLPLTINGVTSYTWFDSAGPTSSASFTTVHFTELAANSSTRNTRGYFRGTATWTKTFALSSASQALQKQFTFNVPGTLARYDLGDTARLFSIRFTTTVTDSSGNNVPLENGGVSTQNVIINAFNGGTPNNTPVLTNLTLTPNFIPSGQLDSRNRTFRVSVRMDHQEAVPSNYQGAATTQSTSLQRLLHFNGTLLFDTLPTHFTSITNIPTAGALGINLVNTVINVPSGTIPGFPTYSFGSGGDMGVELFSNGDAKVTSGARPVVVADGGRIEAIFGGIKVSYSSTTLRNSGILSGTIVVHLPQGLGYTAARASSSGRYNSTVTFPGQQLTSSDFRHIGLLKQATPSDAWVFDEARPLLYRAISVQFSQGGSLTFVSDNAEWVHQQAADQLETQQNQSSSMRYRLTNDGHLRYARINTNRDIEFRAHADGSARTHWANLDVVPGLFRTHFPKNSPCLWSGSGVIRIRDGAFSSESVVSGAFGVTFGYDGTCEADACGPAPGSAADSVTLSPVSGQFRYTPSGGIYAAATMSPKILRWGIRGDGTAAHRTDTFSQAEFHAPGHQLYASDQALASSGPLMDVAATLSPASLLMAGHDAANHSAPVYFGSTRYRYRDGVGAYAGATMTVAGGGQIGASRLADAVNEYPYVLLEGVSKYYVRPSGVSGRHAAGDESFQPNLQLYGYNFGIKRFQLTFLSNANEKSWINGGVTVPYPSQFSQDFLGLSLTCTGALGPAKIDPKDSGAKPLAYWNGSFTPIRMNFAPVAGGGCYGPRFLSVGLVSGAANILTPLFGSLAFLPSGSIAPLAANIEGVDGRLGLPASLPFDGPGNERYQLTPVSKLYFNDPFAANAPSSGFVGFYALCGVPFFEDLKVHLMTSA